MGRLINRFVNQYLWLLNRLLILRVLKARPVSTPYEIKGG